MAASVPINFHAEDEGTDAPVPPESSSMTTGREGFLSQPNISQPKPLSQPVVKRQRSKRSKRQDKLLEGLSVRECRLSQESNQDGWQCHEQIISPRTMAQPAYIPYYPDAKNAEYQAPATAPMFPAASTAGFCRDTLAQYRRATAGPFFGPFTCTTAGPSHAPIARTQAQSFQTSLTASATLSPPHHQSDHNETDKQRLENHKDHTDPTKQKNKKNTTRAHTMSSADKGGERGGLGPPPKLGNYFPHVPAMPFPTAMHHLVRPIDNLHHLMEAFNDELDRLMAAVKENSGIPDPGINAFKQDIITRLVTEIIPLLGVTTTRVGSAVRDGMSANDATIALYAGGHAGYATHQMPTGMAAPHNYQTDGMMETSQPIGGVPGPWNYATAPAVSGQYVTHANYHHGDMDQTNYQSSMFGHHGYDDDNNHGGPAKRATSASRDPCYGATPMLPSQQLHTNNPHVGNAGNDDPFTVASNAPRSKHTNGGKEENRISRAPRHSRYHGNYKD
ncbi:hypothetical protein CAC42_5542 [Sphaceloma murrayae]|uniref:Uncharacterized protein n=1 Tax=Sphaceloma murrayae TaxID=2082308 RepID=A0A2K1QYG7_9PEZI|nr:hypothetical protein CAC42_5542 [Sphaceloma murrayae]